MKNSDLQKLLSKLSPDLEIMFPASHGDIFTNGVTIIAEKDFGGAWLASDNQIAEKILTFPLRFTVEQEG